MTNEVRVRLEELHGQHQNLLVKFLHNDLDAAFTFLDGAKLEARHDYQKRGSISVANARAALRTIREFTGRIQNRDEWQRIHSRADELEAAIAAAFG